MKPFLGGDEKLAAEVARHLALWMAYEDIIRVADLKTRASRFERVRKEVGRQGRRAGRGDRLPQAGRRGVRVRIALFSRKRLIAWAERRNKLDAYNVGMHIKTSSMFGYLLVRSLAWMRPWRPMSYRYREEQALIERWLALVAEAARRDAALAREVAECARLIKGYGETHRRGKGNFLAIVDALVENPATADAREQAAAIRKAREAALADPEGQALGKTLGKPVVWMKPVKSTSFQERRAMASVPKPNVSAERQVLYSRMDKHNLAPLWEVLHNLIPNEPATPCQPALWKYKQARPHLMEAGKLITAKEAIRRVLILENPGMRGESCITQSLYAGLQLILPGEIAPSHRHSQSALRFIVEGSGAYTAVDGERTTMRPGDFIITPSWTWHDHGNPGNEPVVWMDGLDIRIVQPFAAQFHEVYPRKCSPCRAARARRSRASATAWRRSTRRAVRQDLADLQLSLRARSRESLAMMAKDQDPDPCHGWKMEFINPLTGGHAMPTIAAFIQLLPKGFGDSPTAAPTARCTR